MSEWISVKDRLPKPREMVLVYHCNGEIKMEYCYGIFPGFSYEPLYGEVTHWMPLPEPPKEDCI